MAAGCADLKIPLKCPDLNALKILVIPSGEKHYVHCEWNAGGNVGNCHTVNAQSFRHSCIKAYFLRMLLTGEFRYKRDCHLRRRA